MMQPDPESNLAQLYATLPLTEPQQIRVLDIFANSTDDHASPLSGQLRVVDLRTSPDFTALSYVWGEYSAVPDIIAYNDTHIPVTWSCYEALCALRQLYGNITIWVDAVCIHQAEEVEKAMQISLMRDIYTWAQGVYIWLGPGDDEAHRAMIWLAESTRHQPSTPGIPWLMGKAPRESRREEIVTTLSMWLADWRWHRWPKIITADALDHLLDCTWISRVWTFQELVLASNPMIICGENAVDWATLQGGLCIWRHPHFHASESAIRYEWNPWVRWVQKTPLYEPLLDKAEVDLVPAISHSIAAWKQLFRIWLSIARPTRWNDIQLREPLKVCASDTPGACSVTAYHQESITLRRLIGLKFGLWFSLIILLWLGLVVLPIDGFLLSLSVPTSASEFRLALYIPACLGGFGLFMVTIAIVKICQGYFHELQRIKKPPNDKTKRPSWISPLRNILRSQRERQASVTEGKQESSTILLRGILQALRERHASVCKDKSFAMHSVLRGLGINISLPDYGDSLGLVYQKLFADLVLWRPALVNLLVDVGPPLAGAPSWVPPRYVYDGVGKDSKMTLDLEVVFEDNEMTLSGAKIGVTTFVPEPFERIKTGDAAHLRRALQLLSRWVGVVQRNAPVTEAYHSIPRAVYDVLCGSVSSTSSPATEGFNLCFRALVEHRAAVMDSEEEQATDALVQHLEENPGALGMLVDLINSMVGKRKVFFSADGHIGSVPPNTAEGDHILILKGVSVPMISRRHPATNTYTLIGPSFVCGYMSLLDFDPDTMRLDWETFRFR